MSQSTGSWVTDAWMETERETDEWMDGGMDGGMDGRMEGQWVCGRREGGKNG